MPSENRTQQQHIYIFVLLVCLGGGLAAHVGNRGENFEILFCAKRGENFEILSFYFARSAKKKLRF